MEASLSCEWIETNGGGSYAMGTIDRIPRRKYHSLLAIREPGRGEPFNALLDVGESVQSRQKSVKLLGFSFGDAVESEGASYLTDFQHRPHPQWSYRIGGTTLLRGIEMDAARDIVRVNYRVTVPADEAPVTVCLRPYLVQRPIHWLTRANPFLNGAVHFEAGGVYLQPYPDLPALHLSISGHDARFEMDGEWIKNLFYEQEQQRGYDAREDTFTPGQFRLELSGDCAFTLTVGTEQEPKKRKLLRVRPRKGSPKPFVARLELAAERYLATTRQGFHSIIAGYPWFGHWGRDAFVSLPGLCLERGAIADAEAILSSYGRPMGEWMRVHGAVCAIPELGLIMTGVDTPLLFARAVQMMREYAPRSRHDAFMPMVCNLLEALRTGADRRVKVTTDGGLYVEPGPWAMTWMDAMVGGVPVTPRHGFAVDLNALFHNASSFALHWAEARKGTDWRAFAETWEPLVHAGAQSFLRRFWSEERGYLADCVAGADAAPRANGALRPNQLWAFALPYSPLGAELDRIGRQCLERIRNELVTPVGLRTLAPSDPHYRGTYGGDQRRRDEAYHQGTVWPWLLGIYADSVQRILGPQAAQAEVQPILDRLDEHMEREACLGHISELFSGDAPHAPGGAPAQAWSAAETLRAAKRIGR